jgi:hypothetical protein
MTIGNKAYKAIERFLFDAELTTDKPFLFFRLAIGFLVLIHFFTIIGDISLLFGSKGILPAEITNLYVDPLVITRQKLSQFLNMDADSFNLLFNTAYIAFACFIIAGFLTRFSALVMLVLNVALIKSNVFFSYGIDYFTGMSLFYLVIFPVSQKYSVDSLLFKRRPAKPVNYLIYRRYIQLHLCLAYFFSGLNKILGFNWHNGEAVWKAINLPYVNLDFKLNVAWLSGFPLLLILIGWLTVILELFYPIIFYKKIRKTWLFSVILMHVGIALVLNLYFFAAIMIIWGVTAFYPFDESAVVVNKPVSLFNRLRSKFAGQAVQ